jgi:ribosome-associated heat shock protein Hsp15
MSGETRQGGDDRIRVDKWLWHARFFKSRTLATRLVSAGRLRVNRRIIAKPRYLVGPGDVLTFAKGPNIRVIEVLAIGKRRGPAAEASTLYNDLSPPRPRKREEAGPDPRPARRDPGSGRPTKRERRATDRLRDADATARGKPGDGHG